MDQVLKTQQIFNVARKYKIEYMQLFDVTANVEIVKVYIAIFQFSSTQSATKTYSNSILLLELKKKIP